MDTTQIETRKTTSKTGKSGKSTKPLAAKTSAKAATQAQPTKSSGTGKVNYQKVGAAAAKSAQQISPQQRYEMIATTAYFMAESAGFRVDSTQNWLAAEQLVDQQLNTQRK